MYVDDEGAEERAEERDYHPQVREHDRADAHRHDEPARFGCGYQYQGCDKMLSGIARHRYIHRQADVVNGEQGCTIRGVDEGEGCICG